MTASDRSAFETNLDTNRANFVPLSPVSFLTRAAAAFANKVAVVDGERLYTYAELLDRSVRLASALAKLGAAKLDTVAILATNVPEFIEALYAAPMLGAVLNPLNTRLDAANIAFCLAHGGAKILLVEREFRALVQEALSQVDHEILPSNSMLPDGRPRPRRANWPMRRCWRGRPESSDGGEQTTNGITVSALHFGDQGDPKGVVYSHRGAYLSALGNGLSFGLTFDSVYLWTLPMFHCCGWSYPWAVVAAGGTQVCLRKVEPAVIFGLIAEHKVTHLCGAPIVLNMLAHAPAEQRAPFSHTVTIATGGAAPPSSIFRSMEALGFRVTYLYGATESYGPATACIFLPEWSALPDDERFAKMARQGVAYPMVEAAIVADPELRPDASRRPDRWARSCSAATL